MYWSFTARCLDDVCHYVVNISRCKRLELVKTNQPALEPALRQHTAIQMDGFFYAGIAFKDFNTVGLEWLKRQTLLQGVPLIQRYERTKNSYLDLVFVDDLPPEHTCILVRGHE